MAGMLILVQHPGALDALAELSRRVPWADERGLVFVAAPGDSRTAVTGHRERDPEVPLGFVADDEHSALAALAGGADEAAVVRPELGSVAAFLGRVDTRARLRAEGNSLRAAFVHAEKLAALGTVVAGVGHEINNPLSAILLSIQAASRHLLPALDVFDELASAAERGVRPPERTLAALRELDAIRPFAADARRMLEDVGSSADAIAAIVKDLRVFARAERDEAHTLVDVEELVDQAIRIAGREILSYGILERDYAQDLPRLVLPQGRIVQVLVNVLVNAGHAIREVARPAHHVRISTRADAEFVALAISDTGPGIPGDAVERIFEPFYTTKSAESGTGLGLAISRSLLRGLGGELSVDSVQGEGATFVCFLPIPTPEALRGAMRHTTIPRSTRQSRAAASVLVVDDDERMLRAYSRLSSSDYRILTARDGAEAIELLESGSAPDVVVMELELGAFDGVKLFDWLLRHRPALSERTLIVTSAGASPAHAAFLSAHPGPVLHKPVRGEELVAALARVIEHPIAPPRVAS
jgi:signal transduction histidine kinase/ActR/RegA family two-component response regulator